MDICSDPAQGAIVYNVVNLKALPIGIYSIGFFAGNILLQIAGVILLDHSSFDRVMGFGLTHLDSYQNTHFDSMDASNE